MKYVVCYRRVLDMREWYLACKDLDPEKVHIKTTETP